MASQTGGDFKRVQNLLHQMVKDGEIRKMEDSRGEHVYSKNTSVGDLLAVTWVKYTSPENHGPVADYIR